MEKVWADKGVYLAIFMACGVGRDPAAAMDFLEGALQGEKPDIEVYYALLEICQRNSKQLAGHDGGGRQHAEVVETSLQILRQARQAGTSPDLKIYHALLRICAEGGHGQKAMELLDEMAELGLKAEWHSFVQTMSACTWKQVGKFYFKREMRRTHIFGNRLDIHTLFLPFLCMNMIAQSRAALANSILKN